MRSILAQTVLWLVGPALATLLIVGATTAGYNLAHSSVAQGHRTTVDTCVTSPDEFFNACAQLDTSQVQDLRTEHGNTDLEVK